MPFIKATSNDGSGYLIFHLHAKLEDKVYENEACARQEVRSGLVMEVILTNRELENQM